jgi:hypothetical protein
MGQTKAMDLSASEYLAGHQFEYDFDNIGNRTTAKAGGDPAGGALRSSIYTPNNLN